MITDSSSRIAKLLLAFLAGAATLIIAVAINNLPKPQPRLPVPIETQRLILTHEFSHAVVALALNPDYPLEYVGVYTDIVEGQRRLGYTTFTGDIDSSTPQKRLIEAAIRYAGMAGEYLILDQAPQGGDDDERVARELCQPRSGKTGTGVRIGLLTDADGNSVKQPAQTCLERAQTLARNLVAENATAIKALVTATLNKEPEFGRKYLSAKEVKALLQEVRLGPLPKDLLEE